MQNSNHFQHRKKNWGQKIVDVLANFFGSWPFIIVLFVVASFWIILNTIILAEDKVFDEAPFETVSFYLTGLAAVQVPIILMFQNRQNKSLEEKETRDLEINRQAAATTAEIQAKLDKLLQNLKDK